MTWEETSLGVYSLTDAERRAYLSCRDPGGFGVREYARETGRSPGTIGNLLARAERKLGEEA
jgi:DNA-directed RNA polymerase specialized sigma24 family protein